MNIVIVYFAYLAVITTWNVSFYLQTAGVLLTTTLIRGCNKGLADSSTK